MLGEGWGVNTCFDQTWIFPKQLQITGERKCWLMNELQLLQMWLTLSRNMFKLGNVVTDIGKSPKSWFKQKGVDKRGDPTANLQYTAYQYHIKSQFVRSKLVCKASVCCTQRTMHMQCSVVHKVISAASAFCFNVFLEGFFPLSSSKTHPYKAETSWSIVVGLA